MNKISTSEFNIWLAHLKCNTPNKMSLHGVYTASTQHPTVAFVHIARLTRNAFGARDGDLLRGKSQMNIVKANYPHLIIFKYDL